MHKTIKTILFLFSLVLIANASLLGQEKKENNKERELDEFQKALLKSDQCNEEGDVWSKSWVSCSKSANPNPARPNSHWILFEFDQAESISSSTLWNANRIGESTMGIRDMYVDYSIDGTTWQTLGMFTVQRAAESQFYTGSVGPDFGSVFMKKILFTVVRTYGNPNCASLAEVQFDIDPTSCYGTLDECGICDGDGKTIWYKDDDNDGKGDPNNVLKACTQPDGFVSNDDDICDTGVYGWSDIGPLFISNGCTGCHGTSGGLDLRSYETIVAGGNKCQTNLLTGENLVGIITVQGFNGCGVAISGPRMNDRVGGSVDATELAMIQAWVDSGAPEFCQCPEGAIDTDNDGICDNLDNCPNFNNQMIGSSCDDGLVCTTNDVIDQFCNCTGTPTIDSDDDGVCDSQDAAPNNPCTADGTIDGIEPVMWTGTVNNDCDLDGIPQGQGDLDDFSACIDQYGTLQNASCICGASALTAGGKIIASEGVGFFASNAAGLPDGAHSGYIGFRDRLVLSYPSLPKGTEICFELGFDEVNGVAGIEMNDVGTYLFENTLNIIDFTMQQYCIQTIENGPQTIVIKDLGSGGVRVDGSIYEYCPCTSTDHEELSPDCQCPGNQFSSTANFVSEVGFANGVNADGEPDNVFTGAMGYLDTLVLDFPDLLPNTKICLTAGFSDVSGVIKIWQSGEVHIFQNTTDEINYTGQEFCFVTPDVLTDNLVYMTDIGIGASRVDGSQMFACNVCQPNDPDTDGDGICDSNDICPNTPNDDSDYDGVCDDIDICVGFDDNFDTDGDGIPNGCDICAGSNDNNDSDNDGVPNGCDVCPGNDDFLDSDNDGIPDGCDSFPCQNFVFELMNQNINTSKKVIYSVTTNGIVQTDNIISYKAGEKVEMLIDFEVESGAVFLADIEACQ